MANDDNDNMEVQENVQPSVAAQQQNQNGQSNGDVAGQNGAEQPPVRVFTDEQMERKVLCRTAEGEIVDAPWHLMTQSRTFISMWEHLGLEESFNKMDTEPFIFPLNEITAECFDRILHWMQMHHGQPEPIVKEDPVTTERIWFKFTDAEKQFFEVDFETVKEYFLASNFLDIRSLYLYCAQECARCIMDKTPEEIREMLCLEDDLSEEDKARIRAEFDIAPEAEAQPGPSGTQPVAVTNGQGAVPPAPGAGGGSVQVKPEPAANGVNNPAANGGGSS